MALFPLKLVPAGTNIDFIGKRWIGFALSMLLMAGTIGILVTEGLNLGIDFAGGILMEIRTQQPADLAELRRLLDKPELGEVSLQNFGDARDVLIRVEVSGEDQQAPLIAQIKELLDAQIGQIDYRKIDYVGPTVGEELIESGYISLTVAFVMVLLYIWFRFEWQFGLGAILALLHDAILMVGFYSFTRFDVGLTSVAAILTVIGYSINDSVVIYDRIRENMRKYKKMPMEELLNRSINDTLSRTIITAVTTILAAGALSVFGGEVIRGFSLALLFGVIVGTYSSVYVAAPVLLYFQLRAKPQEDSAPAEA